VATGGTKQWACDTAARHPSIVEILERPHVEDRVPLIYDVPILAVIDNLLTMTVLMSHCRQG
jgi:hypothetical protein